MVTLLLATPAQTQAYHTRSPAFASSFGNLRFTCVSESRLETLPTYSISQRVWTMTRIFCLSGDNRIVFAGHQFQTNDKQCDARALIELKFETVKEVERLSLVNHTESSAAARVVLPSDEGFTAPRCVWFDSEVRERDAKEDVADGFHFDAGRGSWRCLEPDRRCAAVRRARTQGYTENCFPPSTDRRIRTFAQLIGMPRVWRRSR
jgi:hypothetical protein